MYSLGLDNPVLQVSALGSSFMIKEFGQFDKGDKEEEMPGAGIVNSLSPLAGLMKTVTLGLSRGL